MSEDMFNAPEFVAFPKIPRLDRDIVITEKIDGSNGVIYIDTTVGIVQAGSRNRWISPGKTTDHMGFAGWVAEHSDILVEALGDGSHHGEWYGKGVGPRQYGLDHKRFALFNPKHYAAAEAARQWNVALDVVPVLYDGPFSEAKITSTLFDLAMTGSRMVPGYHDPEGVIIFHTASRHLYKVTIKGDEKPKGSSE
jgi:hypothetical protein